MSNVRVIPFHTEYPPVDGEFSRFVPERDVMPFERDELQGEAVPVILETIDFYNAVCVHGLSADLCDGEGHYPQDRYDD